MTQDEINKAVELIDELITDSEHADYHGFQLAGLTERLEKAKSLLQSDNEGREVLNVKYRYPRYAVKYADGNCPNCNNVVFIDKNSDICTKFGTKLKWPENKNESEEK